MYFSQSKPKMGNSLFDGDDDDDDDDGEDLFTATPATRSKKVL